MIKQTTIKNIIFSKNVKTTLKNTSYITLSEIFMKLISFLWVIFLARSLTVADYGTYNYVNSFILIFAMLPDLGIGLIIVREISRNTKKSAEIIGNALFINLGLSLVTFILVILAAFVLGITDQIRVLILISSFTLFLTIIRSLGIFFFEGTERMHVSAFLTSVNTLLLITFGFLGFSLGYGLFGIFLGMFIGTILSFFLTWYVTSRYVMPKLRIDKKLTKHLIASGLPLGVAAMASIIYTRIDTVIIGQLLNQESVGIYNAALPVVIAIIQIINVPFVIAVYPVLTRLYKKNKKSFMSGIAKSMLFISVITFPTAFFVFLVASIIIPLIFDERYDAAIPILKILIFYVPFASLSALLYKVLVVMNRQLTYLYISIFGVFINVILNLYLISKYSITGAAIASVTTQVILFLVYLIVVNRYVKKI